MLSVTINNRYGAEASHLSFQVLILSFIFLGCTEDTRESPMKRAARQLPSVQTSVKSDSLSTQKPAQSQSSAFSSSELMSGKKTQPNATAASTTPKHSVQQKMNRDLQAELRNLIGDPRNCLSPRSNDKEQSTIEIAVQAYVTSSGVVSRSTVTSPSLKELEIRCIQKRIDNSRFKAPVEDAPQMIQTTIALRKVH